jgi:hypothetical protein
MHTGREGMSAMPYFDDFDLSTVDILLISQYVPTLPPSALASGCIWILRGIVEKARLEAPYMSYKLDPFTHISVVSVAQPTNTILFNKLPCSSESLAMLPNASVVFSLGTDLPKALFLSHQVIANTQRFSVSISIMQQHFHTSWQRPTSRVESL